MNNQLVSVITPAYKAASYIGETIESVLAQTYPHWELLIANDCSPDNTSEVVQEFCARDSRIKLINMAQNGGPAAARNAAISAAQGRWLAFLDSDDLWLPTKLEKSIKHSLENNAAIVFTAFRRISADGQQVGDLVTVPASLNYRQLLGNTAIATSTAVVDRLLSGPVAMRKTYYDDFDCWLQILKRGNRAYGLNEDLMRYRVLGQSVSRNKKKSALHVWRAYRDLEKLNLLQSIWYFAQYALRGLLKYRKF
jgi:teichuronic acid biosynthesis glycosyltransferase TuaG